MRKVFLENLPRWKSGINKGNIDWKESANLKCKVRFIYNDVEGEFIIIDSFIDNKNHKLKLKYNNRKFDIGLDNFKKCRFREIIKRNIWDTDRWMCDLGISKEDAKKYTKYSNESILVKCPECGTKKKIIVGNVYRNKSISCQCNSKGVSYPEKFFSEFLNQLGVEYKFQLTKNTSKWCGRYMYDFFFNHNKESYIVEVNGIQHYKEIPNFKRTLKEEQENDRLKKELAKRNGIDNYIVLNCSYSNLDFIKNSIMNSYINKVFNLKNIDWNKCNKSALSNIVKEVCDYWENKHSCETTTDLSNIFNLSRDTIISYLKKGNEIGWCIYNPKEELKKVAKKNKSTKKVKIFKDGILLGVYNSAKELCDNSKKEFGVTMINSGITQVIKGKKKHYKGYTFEYIEKEITQAS